MTDTLTTSYTIDPLPPRNHRALRADPGRGGKLAAGHHVERALRDTDFIATHLKARAPGGDPREVLYEDPELGLCVCGHGYDGPAHGKPHDHGESWAIYGQAEQTTEMTDWRIVETGEGKKTTRGEPVGPYPQ